MKRLKLFRVVFIFIGIFLFLGGCSTKKNNASTRFYHRVTTNFNVLYNGENAFQESYNAFIDNYSETYSSRIFLDPIEAQRGLVKKSVGGAFDRALEKGSKAIKMHSIRVKPQQKRRASAKEKAFYKRKEFNSALHKAWLLVGKAQFYNGDFLESMSTFSYMSRIYSDQRLIRDEARLWQARCYIAMGWMHDAALLIDNFSEREILEKKSKIYSKTQAELSLALSDYSQAITHIQKAIKKEESKKEKMRMLFLLGQLQALEKKGEEAKKSFRKVLRKAPPFDLEIACRLQLVKLVAEKDLKEAIQLSEKLAKKSRNKEVLDRVYLTQGNLYLLAKDTTNAFQSFSMGVEKSKEKKSDYALCQIHLGNLYREQKEWVKAQKAFSEGVAALDRMHESYKSAETFSKRLDALVIHAQAVELQDSLRTLAKLPEIERNKIIDSAITAYTEQQKELQKNEALAEQEEKQRAANEEMGTFNPNRSNPQVPSGNVVSGKFYFYNPQLIAQGKAKFTQLWGQRVLEDNWRRRKKELKLGDSSSSLPENKVDSLKTDSIPSQEGLKKEAEQDENEIPANQDPTKREYYLAQLPFSEEQIQASDLIIQQGLLGMGKVFEEEMELFADAIGVLEDLLVRYPLYENRLEVYYSLYMLSERIGDKKAAYRWKEKMQEDFPEEAISKAVADPLYLKKLQSADSLMNEDYKAIFSYYIQGESTKVRDKTALFIKDYPISPLRPKVLYINALSYMLENKSEAFQAQLDSLLKEYPSEDVSEPAQQILTELLKGRKVYQGGYTGIDYDKVFTKEGEEVKADSLYFVVPNEKDPQQILLLFNPEGVNQNELIFAVNTFNFSSFTKWNLKTSLSDRGALKELKTLGIIGEKEAWNYIKKAYSPKGFMSILPPTALLFAISDYNLEQLQKGKSLEEYFAFLSEQIEKKHKEASLSVQRFVDVVTMPKKEEENEKPPLDEEIDEPEPTLVEKDSIQEIIPFIPKITPNKGISYKDVEEKAKERKLQEEKEKKEKQKAKEEEQKKREEQLKKRKEEREKLKKERAKELKRRREEARQKRKAIQKERKRKALEKKRKRAEQIAQERAKRRKNKKR